MFNRRRGEETNSKRAIGVEEGGKRHRRVSTGEGKEKEV